MSSLASDKEGRAEQDETNWISTDIHGVPSLGSAELDAARTTSKTLAIQLKLSRYAEEKVYSVYANLRSRTEASQVSIGEDMRAVSRNTELFEFLTGYGTQRFEIRMILERGKSSWI